jgi:hypothetical protein
MLAARLEGASAAGLKAAAAEIVRDPDLQEELAVLLQEASGGLRRGAFGAALRVAELRPAAARQWHAAALDALNDPDYITRLSAVRLAGLISWSGKAKPELCARLKARAADEGETAFVRCWALTAWAEHGEASEQADIERLAQEFAALGSGSMAARGRRILSELKRRGTLGGTS